MHAQLMLNNQYSGAWMKSMEALRNENKHLGKGIPSRGHSMCKTLEAVRAG